MDVASLGIGLTRHGHLFLTHDANAPRLDERLHDHLRRAFERGPGHGLLLLGADEVGTVLPPVHSYWREFGARYVTALCTQQAAPIAAPASDELDRIARAAPPMMGAEYLSAAVLEALWREIDAAFGMELSESECGVQDFLRRRNPAWNLVGRVHFNLAENRKDSDAPFAFLATYTTRLSAHAKAQHLPLGEALREYAGAANRQRLLSLLVPVQRASEKCPTPAKHG
jgi:non-specific serine/threonine protein kinase